MDPEFMIKLGDMDTEIVYVPSRMLIPYFLETDLFARIRARENCNYSGGGGEAGKFKPRTYIAGPLVGDLIIDLTHIGNQEGVVYKTIDIGFKNIAIKQFWTHYAFLIAKNNIYSQIP